MDTTLTLLLNGSDNIYLDSVVMLATKPLTWIPLYLAILYVLVREHNFRELGFITAVIFVTILISDQVSSSIVKPIVARWRPTHDPAIQHLVDTVAGYRGGNYGFFSSHASNTAALATLVSLILRHRTVTVTLSTWCLINCWTRIYLGVHFVSDILAGLAFGFILGLCAWRLLIHWVPKLRTIKYSSTRLSVITNIFLITLALLTIPWKVAH